MPWWLPAAIGGGVSLFGSLFGRKEPEMNIPQIPYQLRQFTPYNYEPMRQMLYAQAQRNLEQAFQTGSQQIQEQAAARGIYQSGLPSLGQSIMRGQQQTALGNVGAQLGSQAIQQRGAERQQWMNNLLQAYLGQISGEAQRAGISQQNYQNYLQGLGGFGQGMGQLSMMLQPQTPWWKMMGIQGPSPWVRYLPGYGGD